MKKLVCIIIVAIASAMTITSCTEEKIEPSPLMNGGGSGSERPR